MDLSQEIETSIRNNILNVYRGVPRNIRNPNRISILSSSSISSRYFNNPPVGGYIIDEEHNYVLPDQDDITSRILLDVITSFGSPGNDTFIKNHRKEQIKNINYHKIKINDLLLEQDCSICLERFKVNEYQKTLVCKHSFHKKCIDRWFKKEHSNCPMCRTIAIN